MPYDLVDESVSDILKRLDKDRVKAKDSLHEYEKPERCPNSSKFGKFFINGLPSDGHSTWRTIKCDNELDVIECSRCGKQKTVSCNFDEDYS